MKGLKSAQDGAPVLAAAYRLDAARRELSAARACFAELTLPETGQRFLAPDFEPFRPVIQKARSLHRKKGVVGTALGHRIRRGLPDPSEPVITVFVTEKIEPLRRVPVSARVPRSVRARGGARLATDVVEVGPFRHAAAPGDSVGPELLPASATLSCFATDRALAFPVAITVMHLITDEGIPPRGDLRFVSPSLDADGPRPLGSYLRGSLENTDAMAIALDDGVLPRAEIPGIGTIRGWRPLIDPGDRFIAVRMRGAVSGRRIGRVEKCSASFPSIGLDDAIVASIDVDFGDSGALIVDNDGFALGILKGFFDGEERRGVFAPIGPLLKRLKCTIP